MSAKSDRDARYYQANRFKISTRVLARARQNRQDAITAAGGGCVRCAGTEKLQFDHIDPKTKSCHKIWTWSKARRDIELAKCQLLCERCHIQKTIDNHEHQWKTRPY